jgi:hypothetical protein
MEKCFVKFPSLRPQNQKTIKNQQRQNNLAKSIANFVKKTLILKRNVFYWKEHKENSKL